MARSKDIKNAYLVKLNKYFIIIGGVATIILMVWGFSWLYLRNKYPVETSGKVINEEAGSHNGRGFEYEFYLSGVRYSGFTLYDCEVPTSNSLVCKVVYQKGNPNNSTAYYNGRYSGCNIRSIVTPIDSIKFKKDNNRNIDSDTSLLIP